VRPCVQQQTGITGQDPDRDADLGRSDAKTETAGRERGDQEENCSDFGRSLERAEKQGVGHQQEAMGPNHDGVPISDTWIRKKAAICAEIGAQAWPLVSI
jgi:hypothetical protein